VSVSVSLSVSVCVRVCVSVCVGVSVSVCVSVSVSVSVSVCPCLCLCLCLCLPANEMFTEREKKKMLLDIQQRGTYYFLNQHGDAPIFEAPATFPFK